MTAKWILTALILGVATVSAQEPAAEPPASTEPPGPGTPDFTGAAKGDATTALDGVSASDLETAVKLHGYTYQWITESNGKFIEATTTEGLKFSMRLNDCAAGAEAKCSTLNLSSYLFNENVRVTLKSINEWNQNSWGGRGNLYKDGTSDVVMQLGVNGGVTQAWLLARFGNYDFIIKSFSDMINGTTP